MSTQQTAADGRAFLEQCIARMSLGDKNALAAFYEKTRDALYGFVLAIVKNQQDAEDVLQDTYLRIYGAAGGYQATGSPMPWVFTIARNLALMRLRQHARRSDGPADDDEALFDVPDDRGLDPDERILLREVIRSLNDEERQIVMLHAVGGFKHREIAHMLGLALPTVLSKYNRALKKLRAQMKGE